MKLFKNQAGFNDTILVAIVGGIVGALFITGVFVWQEIKGEKYMNDLVVKVAHNVSVINSQLDKEITFPNSYFLRDSEVPEGFVVKGEKEVENLGNLESAYGNVNTGLVEDAYVAVYNKPDKPNDEVGIMIIKYIHAGRLDTEIEKITAATGYENVPLITPSEDTESVEDEECETWGCAPLDTSKMNLSTTALVGARDDSIYLRNQDVLLVVWSDSGSNMKIARGVADILKKRINTIEEIETKNENAFDKVFIFKGSVYYKKDDTTETKKIATAKVDYDDPVNNFTYYEAKLSPNKKFILLGAKAWESVVEEVYDMDTEEIHRLEASGSNYGEWLEDNRVRIEGECGMGISCGIYESIDSDEPWILEKIGDYE